MRTVGESSGGFDWLVPWFGDRCFGCLVDGFESQVRILHAMWEDPDLVGSTATHDEAFGVPEWSFAHMLEGAVLTGMPVGPVWRPPGWERLEWSELAARLGIEVDFGAIDPLGGFQPKLRNLRNGSWPASIQPPPEGSMDWDSYKQLFEILDKHTESDVYYRVDPPLDSPNRVLTGTMDELLGSYQDLGSGINWWPADHSWLVYTDWDLTTTIVQGSQNLISEVTNDQRLETVPLERRRIEDDWIPLRTPPIEKAKQAETASGREDAPIATSDESSQVAIPAVDHNLLFAAVSKLMDWLRG